ncbi:MAG: dTDP-4-dehydrorhamnose 3,5-epimerase family protein [Candidatus Micrarchaeota archaeon]|nr:dTDP-4-dehydrorhamnose 3,5-epimerase family protein [Candidatus Micrarchaeota archaeon]
MLEGVKVTDIKKLPDERGFFAEVFREDWKEFLGDDKIAQANLSMVYPGIIKAWHRHTRGQVDYFLVLKGAVKLCAYDEKKKQLDEIILSSERLQVARIPGHYWHGSKVISSEPALMIYFVTKLYDYKNPDEERKAWNDPSIIDSKAGKPFDWNKLPHK